jgi:predicted TIM-barrel fold metal-dependent hydrolase
MNASSDHGGAKFSFGGLEPDRPEYLARQLAEDVLEPGIEIVDAHHHLWDVKGGSASKLGGSAHRYLMDEFAADISSGHNVKATVFVECRSMYRATGPLHMRPVGEVEFAAGMGAMSDSGTYGAARVAAAVVGQADLTRGAAVREVLQACAAVGSGRFRGVRHSAGWAGVPGVRNNATATAPELYRSAAFQEGARCLSALGFTLDAFVFHHQLYDVVALARAEPQLRIALCHCGGPLGFGSSRSHQEEVFGQWRARIGTVAACENVTVKLGGMLNRLGAFDFRHAARPPTSLELAPLWEPYIATCVELFGAERSMFESNFPVEKMGVTYRVLWNSFKRIVAGCSVDEKRHLFSETARGFYRVGYEPESPL